MPPIRSDLRSWRPPRPSSRCSCRSASWAGSPVSTSSSLASRSPRPCSSRSWWRASSRRSSPPIRSSPTGSPRTPTVRSWPGTSGRSAGARCIAGKPCCPVSPSSSSRSSASCTSSPSPSSRKRTSVRPCSAPSCRPGSASRTPRQSPPPPSESSRVSRKSGTWSSWWARATRACARRRSSLRWCPPASAA